MKIVYLAIAATVVVGLLFGAELSSILFQMFFLWWIPVFFVFVGAMLWISIGRKKKPSKLSRFPQHDVQDERKNTIEHKD